MATMNGTREFGGQRGVALLLVLTAVVILAAAVTEFSYNTRINLAMTSHAQKEVQAYFAARSGIMIALFVLEAKEVVDRIVGTFASAAGGMNTQNIEIWRAIEPLCGGLSSSRFNLYGIDLMDMEGLEGMGMPEGQEFKCGVELEDGKININGVASIADKQTLHGALRGVFMQHFMSDLFNENEKKVDEVIAAIIDWADQDDNKTQVEQGVVIESQGGMGEGGGKYSKFGYKVKNAKYDSVEELNYVDGVTDGVFCLLKDKVTVYNTEKLNVNSADIETIKGLVCSHLLDKGMILCNPQIRAQGLPAPIDIIGEYLEVCREAKNRLFTPPFSSAQSFVQFFNRLGVFVQQDIPLDGASLSQKVGTKGRIWRVVAEGKSGKVVRRIQVVLDTSTGKIVYWRE
jgi:type II secretory pathway component PulK